MSNFPPRPPPPPQNPGHAQPSQSQPHTINDALSHDFPELSNLSRDEMVALLEDEEYFDAVVNTLPSALSAHAQLEHMLSANLALAQRNESLRPALESLRAETADLFTRANVLKGQFTGLEAAQVDSYKRFAPTVQINRLKAATSTQLNLLESLTRTFLEGGMEEDMFSAQYVELSRVYHKRLLMLEKWEKGEVDFRI